MVITGMLYKVREFTTKQGAPGKQVNVETMDIRLASNLVQAPLPALGQEISLIVDVGSYDGRPTFTATDIVGKQQPQRVAA